MFDFENKPVKDWTLEQCQEYCKTKTRRVCDQNEYTINYCVLAKYGVCCRSPISYNFITTTPEFTPDEVSFLRLIKKTYPWAEYIVRGESGGLRIFEKDPIIDGFLCEKPNTKSVVLNDSFFPQIESLTSYSIDDILEQEK